jgi:hypothetical protein
MGVAVRVSVGGDSVAVSVEGRVAVGGSVTTSEGVAGPGSVGGGVDVDWQATRKTVKNKIITRFIFSS